MSANSLHAVSELTAEKQKVLSWAVKWLYTDGPAKNVSTDTFRYISLWNVACFLGSITLII